MIRFVKRETGQSSESGGGSLIQTLLRNRGITEGEAAERFFAPSAEDILDPFGLPDMQAAVDRISDAVAGDELICIYGDYDVDGMCATAMLVLFLESSGARVMYRISHRDDGYGINPDAVAELSREGVSLIITVDNGITAFEAVDKCRELGVSIIVTDHHICGEALPKCDAVICPKRVDSAYENRNLCGAGVAFKLIEALSDPDSAMEYISLAGIATISDIVSLTGENRAIAYLALCAINEGYCPVGVTALCAKGAAKRELVRERDIAFGVAPRMNAAGRIDDAAIGVRVLCSDSRAECDRLAERLSELNKERQDIEAAIRNEVVARVDADDITDKRIIVLESPDWHPGVLGIVASKITEKYCRPTVLLTRNGDTLTGSSRSVPNVDIHKALGSSAQLFERFGGHSQAAGLTLPSANLDEFIANSEKYLAENYSFDCFIPSRTYEAEVDFRELELDVIDKLDRFAPFGDGNPEPIFCARGVKLYSLARAGADGSHLRADAVQGGRSFPAIFFGAGDRFDSLLYADTVDILYTPMENRWKEQKSLQLRLVAVNPVSVRAPEEYAEEHKAKFIGAFLNNITYNGSCEDMAPRVTEGNAKLCELFREREAGVCALCLTPHGAARALELTREYSPDVAFGRPTGGPCAYNTLLLAPQLRGLDLSRFREVLIYDDCGTDGVAAAIAAQLKNGRLCVSDAEDDAWYKEMADSLVLDREEYKAHYVTLLSMGDGNVLTASALSAMERRTGRDAARCRFVLNVFAELGFIAKVSGTVLKLNRQAPFRELSASACYTAAASFAAERENTKKKRADRHGEE